MILLTGATGKTGSVAASLLAPRGIALRALVRDAARAETLQKAGVDLVVGDIADKALVRQALEGVDKALLILPNSKRQLELETQFVDCAAAAGVRHIVKLSSMEAVPEAEGPIPRIHYQSEEYIKNSGMRWTMVKPNFFMQNLLGNAATIREQHKFFLPMGEGKTGMSDTRDVGAVIAEVLSGAGHENQSYAITGPELLTFADVADRFSEVLETKIEYVDMPAEAYREILSRFLTDEWHLNAVCALFAEIAAGRRSLTCTTDTFRQLMGREPIALKTFIQDHLAVFKAD
jgi:uncharacterized protein YbjT (DUF2867 family)